jgi:hypothetical protein
VDAVNGLVAVTFLALASALMWMIIAARGRWLPKLLAILAVAAFAGLLWRSAGTFSGWPVGAALPARSLFVGAMVVEPTPDADGHIYLWLVPPASGHGANIYAYRPGDGEPRAYARPYDRGLHEAVQAAQDITAAGRQAVLDTTGAPGKRAPGGPPRGDRRGRGTRGGKYRVYQLPPSALPPKG